MENPLEMRRSQSTFVPSTKQETNTLNNNYDNLKPRPEPDNYHSSNASMESEHQAHCEYRKGGTVQCECTIETSSQEDSFNINQEFFQRRNLQNGLSPLDILKGSVHSEPERPTQHVETNSNKISIIEENGNESPLHFGLNYYVHSLDNLHTKSSQESAAQEENQNSKVKDKGY